MRIQNNRGVALVFTMFFVVIMLVLEGIFIFNVVHESQMSRSEREQAKVSYAAHGGAQAAIEQLETLINTNLQTTISSASPSGVITYAQGQVNSGDGLGWLVYAVRSNNIALLTQNGEEASYSGNGSLGGTNYSYSITFTEKNDPSAVGTDAWDFPFSYRIDTTANLGTTSNKIVLSGDFTVRLQRDNFAKFALFTNNQQMPNGTNVWFTNKTNFAGPLHTNDRYNIALNPSGIFEEIVSQYQQTARFYNSGSNVLLNSDHNGTTDVPTFKAGFNRNVPQVSFTAVTTEQSMISQVIPNNTYGSNGVYLPTTGTTLSGGIYVQGDGAIALSVNGQGNAVYTITQGATTKTITVDRTNNQTSVLNSSNGSTTTYTGKPEGSDGAGTIIFVNGNISSLSGTVQQDTEVTIASHNDIVINNHLKYSQYTPAVNSPGQSGYVPPNATGYSNLLGLVSWGGSVRIGTSAPNNVEIHGTVMAMGTTSIFTVDNYSDQGAGPRGIATLLGGAISNNYGAFGLYNGSTGAQLAGYGRNFIYDSRMQQGKAPPYFPSLNTFIAFTNDITDKIVWQEGE